MTLTSYNLCKLFIVTVSHMTRFLLSVLHCATTPPFQHFSERSLYNSIYWCCRHLLSWNQRPVTLSLCFVIAWLLSQLSAGEWRVLSVIAWLLSQLSAGEWRVLSVIAWLLSQLSAAEWRVLSVIAWLLSQLSAGEWRVLSVIAWLLSQLSAAEWRVLSVLRGHSLSSFRHHVT